LGLCPCVAWECHDTSVAIDYGGNAHVHGSANGAPAFDGAKSAYREMLFMLTRSIKPAVVGDVDEEVGRRTVSGGRCVVLRQLRVGVFVTDQDAIPIRIERKSLLRFTRPDAVIEIVRREFLHPGKCFSERHIFAERHTMYLVVSTGYDAIGCDI